MKVLNYEGLSFDDICLVPRYSDISRKDVSIKSGDFSSPIINSPMIHTCSPKMMRYFIENDMICTIHRYFDSVYDQMKYINDILSHYDNGINQHQHPYMAVGTLKYNKIWIDKLIDEKFLNFCIDVAHGDTKQCVETIRYIKNTTGGESSIMVGNVAMADGFAELEQAGADYIRVGISSGSACLTYNNTGVGTPMITSLIECHKVRRKAKIIADGGIRMAGDMAKAMAVGSDYIMIGGLLASTSYGSGQCYDNDLECVSEYSSNIAYKQYAGMASTFARNTTKSQKTNVSIEGVHGKIKYNGETPDFINDIHQNLISSMAYLGATNWNEFNSRAKIMKISNASRIEKDTHLI